MKVVFDKTKNRLVSGAADQHIKFHDLTSELVTYNIKIPSPLSSLDFSSDGKHFAIGMVDGSLVIRSKKFT
jgi:WD40 repeat protein